MRGQVEAPADHYLPAWIAGSVAEEWFGMLPYLIGAEIDPPCIVDALHFVTTPITDSACYVRATGRIHIAAQTGARIV